LNFAVAALLAASFWLVSAAPSARANDLSHDEIARFLAGLPPGAQSPLAALSTDQSWQRHAKYLDGAWDGLERRQLSKIRDWSKSSLKDPQKTAFYMFSGPDFLYVNAVFPDATTYVLAGLEPVGRIPQEKLLSKRSLSQDLRVLEASLNSVLSYSFFITKKMASELRSSEFNGTMPILYIFLARSGKTIHDVALVNVDKDGALQEGPGDKSARAPGVKITFSSAGAEAKKQTLYYFSTDISDTGLKTSNFNKFLETQGIGDSFIKSASYLLHSGSFGKIRDFLLANSKTLVQDDSGIPAQYFDAAKWEFHPYGSYLGPISLFNGRYQAKLRDIYAKGPKRPITFGLGYRWRPHESNVLVAVKKQ
jgi:hypothetical protein